MNISVSALEAAAERDGAPADERPQYVESALAAERRVGYRTEKPVVPHPDGAEEDMRLGDSITREYDHYPSNSSDLFKPRASDFLEGLASASEVDSVSEISEELPPSISGEDVSRALELHGIDAPQSTDDDITDDDVTKGFELPSGEVVVSDVVVAVDDPWRSTLALADMLSAGMGVGEIARYVSKKTGENVTPEDVREASRRAGLLGENSDSDVLNVRDSRHRRTSRQ